MEIRKSCKTCTETPGNLSNFDHDHGIRKKETLLCLRYNIINLTKVQAPPAMIAVPWRKNMRKCLYSTLNIPRFFLTSSTLQTRL